MTIKRFVTGRLKENCYFVSDASRAAVVIDPGGDAKTLIEGLHQSKVDLKAILCTHGHFDHIGAVNPIQTTFHVPMYIHSAELVAFREAILYGSLAGSSQPSTLPEDVVYLDNLDRVAFGPLEFRLLPTPGHSPGGTTFWTGNNLFTGDTLFSDRPGRADLPGGNKPDLQRSLRTLSNCPSDSVIYPGHGSDASLAEVLANVRVSAFLSEQCETGAVVQKPGDESEPARAIVLEALAAVNAVLPVSKRIPLLETATLFGSVGSLDSLGLVRLLVTIEQLAEERTGKKIRFAADRDRWMRIRPFRSIVTLADYISLLLEDSPVPSPEDRSLE